MFIADFHIHSNYSRATSKECVPELLEFWARRKGINVIGTGDFTHSAWREELKEKLLPAGEGLYALKNDYRQENQVAGGDVPPQFIVSGEISSIYKKNGRVRKVHNLILLPSLEHGELISRRLEAIGNLHSDGRPILGLDSRDLLEIVLDICPEAIFIPAHIWTPHFSLFGAYSGFDDIRECFEDLTEYIYALETGLSSDPPMNWRLSALDGFTLVSNSDAHSPGNLGREANIFHTELSYPNILQALKNRKTKEFYGTIEFFPEEGKYHYDGHRACKICCKPAETKAAGGICPVCGGRITVGVLHRVEVLADREEGFVPSEAKDFERLVPLSQVIASSIGATTASSKVKDKYDHLIRNLGPEFFILREAVLKDIELVAGPFIGEGIRRLRRGQVEIQPGYDGEYGKIKIMDKSEIHMLSGQLSLINDKSAYGKSPSMPKTIEGIKVTSPESEPIPGVDDHCPPSGSKNNDYGLNEEQWEAVSSSSPAIAVIAGPGTGKTKTLVSRIAYLVEKCGVHPAEITAVTFTNKAAHEMRLRLEKHFGDKRTARAMTIGTFHSICLQILSQGKGKNKKKITIIDEYHALSLIEEVLKDKKFPISPRDALKGISLMKNGAAPGDDEKKNDALALIYELYCTQLKRYGVMDYDDILLEVLQQFKTSFSHLLVDEFQDINEIQYHLIKEWSKKSNSIFIIGDPDQSIYGFRGSDFRYFEKFKEDFPDLQQIQLTQNYRSTPQIITCAKSVISKKTAGGLACGLEAKRESGTKVCLIETKDDFSEALFVTKEINRMVGGIDMLDAHTQSTSYRKKHGVKHPRGFSDITVLYRTNRQAEIFEQCFSKEGIPYVVVGRDEFLSDKLVRETIAFFKFLLNPGDLASLLLCLKAENISSVDSNQKILENYEAGRRSISALATIMEESQLPLDKPGKPLNFIEMLKKYQPLIKKEKPGIIIESWINDNNLSGTRCMDLLLNTSVMYRDMGSFAQNLMLGRESDVVRSGSKVYDADAVSLMTMHGAKGLEFPIVFICGVNDGKIPLRSNRLDSDIDEERRLFYVGMTRARDELILLTSHTPSPFITDIPEEQLITENGVTQKQVPQYKQVSLF
ncbi:MAG: UvrD-helicase domain-containing protein [Dehalobacterium sp.]